MRRAKGAIGIKRNAVVDTIGLLLASRRSRPAFRTGTAPRNLSKRPAACSPSSSHVFADGGYSGDNLATDLAAQQVTLKIVKRMDKKGGFKVIRRRWVVERTFSWLRRNRRLMAHYEAIAIIAEGFAKLAMISVTLKRLTEPRPKPAS